MKDIKMDIIVCIKRVPDFTEVDLVIDASGKRIKDEGLVYSLNDWDNYAVEEAVREKEKFGGKVTAITIGNEESEDVLRRALALGADEAIRITDSRIEGSDGYATARILSEVIKDLPFDLIFTGVQANDDAWGQVGLILAELLNIPHAALVTNIEINGKKAKVNRELEGGMEEVVEIGLPALLTIQTGINEPRYVSIMGIRKVVKKEIKVLDLNTIGLGAGDAGEAGSFTILEKLFIPPSGEGAEIFKGSMDEIAGNVADILEKEGVI
jgi:electron transfer flavoprotein beta subunit